jgi:hypothetical protein
MIGFLGTPVLILLTVLGFRGANIGWVFALAVINAFIGLHTPNSRALVAIQQGVYLKLLITSYPLQLLFAFLVYGLGALLGAIF